jgi:hypothetical protein
MVEQSNTVVAADAATTNDCPVCIARAERDAHHAAMTAERSAERRARREAREAYKPDGQSETYDGPLDEDGEPETWCLYDYNKARDAFALTPERARGRLHILIRAHRAQIDALNRELEELG